MNYINLGYRIIPDEFILTEDFVDIPKGTHYVVKMEGHRCILEKKNGQIDLGLSGVIMSYDFMSSAQLEACSIERYLKLKVFL